MISHKVAYRVLYIFLAFSGFFPVCCSHAVMTGVKATMPVEMRQFLGRGGYVYSGEYYFLPIRGGVGSRFLDVTFDSAAYSANSRRLYVNGRVMESGSTRLMQGVQVVIGHVLQDEIRMISETDPMQRPFSMARFRMIPRYEDTTDHEGRFSLCATIDSASSLMIATNSFHLNLYDIGKLVDSAWTQ